MPQIDKVPGGLAVDGLEFRRGKCGCGGMGGDCCFTFSRVKREGNTLIYEGKATAPATHDNFEWGYRVRKGEMVVQVHMEDTRDPHDFFAGSYPPPLAAFVERGWEVEESYQRSLSE